MIVMLKNVGMVGVRNKPERFRLNDIDYPDG
jgi:hypothetical protein